MVAQKYPFKSFLIPSLNLSLFGTTFLRVWNIEGFDFKYDNSFQNYICNNTQIRHLKSQIWYFFENETFNLEKPEDADVSYENNFSKFQPKNTQIRHKWSQFLLFLILHETLHFENPRMLIQSMTLLFQNGSLKIPK